MSEGERDAYRAGLARVEGVAAARIAAEVDPVTPPVGVADYVDHIDYLVGLIGIEHVGTHCTAVILS